MCQNSLHWKPDEDTEYIAVRRLHQGFQRGRQRELLDTDPVKKYQTVVPFSWR